MDFGVSSSCITDASFLLRISVFLGIAYGLGHLFNAIRCETSACAQDGPPGVHKTDKKGCSSYAQLIYPMLMHRIIHVPTR